MFSLLPAKCRCFVYILEINPELAKQIEQGVENSALGIKTKWFGSIEKFVKQFAKTKHRRSDLVLIFADYIPGEESGMENLFLLHNNMVDTCVFMLHNTNELDLNLYKNLASSDCFIVKDENLIQRINNVISIKYCDHLLARRKFRLMVALTVWLAVLIVVILLV